MQNIGQVPLETDCMLGYNGALEHALSSVLCITEYGRIPSMVSNAMCHATTIKFENF